MEVVWKLERASVREVTDALKSKAGIAYNTVQTTMRILEDKGYLAHEKDGRRFTYQAKIGKHTAQKTAVKQLLISFFDDSPGALVANLIEAEELSNSEIDELKKMIDEF